MLLTVNQFCDCVQSNLNALVYKLADNTSRHMGDEEKKDLTESYKAMSVLFTGIKNANPAFGDVNITSTNLLLEYKLPSASAWCDLVLLGDNKENKHNVIIIELKNWDNIEISPAETETLIIRKGGPKTHPSDQVKGYTEYCQRFHSTVVEEKADVKGLVFFTKDIDITPFCSGIYSTLTNEYPMYCTNPDSIIKLEESITEAIHHGNKDFAEQFQKGFYKQDRNILKQVAESLASDEAKDKKMGSKNPFVLVDEQRDGFNEVMAKVAFLAEGEKEVIIVKGPPGCGKSAIAINIWIQAALKYGAEMGKGNVVFVTTSASQYYNWEALFSINKDKGAAGMILKSNDYNPGIHVSNVNQEIVDIMREINEEYTYTVIENKEEKRKLKKEYYKEVTNALLERCRKGMKVPAATKNYSDNHHFISIVDEAHSLFNPLNPNYVQSSKLWMQAAGPQAYHIIRESRISVFFMDDKQSFRDVETTSVEDIIKIAKEEFGVDATVISLEGLQFRCAGSNDYMEWVEAMFSDSPVKNHAKWQKDFKLSIVNYPSDVEEYLRTKLEENTNATARILSSYTEKWVSKGLVDVKHEKEAEYDFILEDKDGTVWKKYWNAGGLNGQDPDYSIFVQGTGHGAMSKDPLSEVGCAYVIRGFDYDHVGILWLDDLVIRDGKWFINIDKCEETTIKNSISCAKKEMKKKGRNQKLYPATDKDFPQCHRLFMAMSQAYRILLSRPVKSVVLYIRDKETREYIESLL